MIEDLIFIVVTALCVYTIVDRICRCLEKRSTMRAFGDYVKNGGPLDDAKERLFKNTGKNN